MANALKLVPIILKWEGGLSGDNSDRAAKGMCPTPLNGKYYHTNKGITYTTWKQVFGSDKDERFLNMSDADWMSVMKPYYWDRWKADQINNQSIANILVDWVWASGKWGIKHPQRVLVVSDDGVVGPNTLNAINSYPDQYELFIKLYNRRKQHFESIAARDPSQNRFLKGWLNRLADFTYKQ